MVTFLFIIWMRYLHVLLLIIFKTKTFVWHRKSPLQCKKMTFCDIKNLKFRLIKEKTKVYTSIQGIFYIIFWKTYCISIHENHENLQPCISVISIYTYALWFKFWDLLIAPRMVPHSKVILQKSTVQARMHVVPD